MERMITKEEIVTIAMTRKNYDASIFKDAIIETAELDYIEPILGEYLYDEIKTQYLSNTLTALNTTLVNTYLKKIVAFGAVHICLPTMMVDISSIGLQLNSTEFSSPISSSLRAELARSIESIVNTFTNKLIKFLEDNNTDYPLYEAGDNPESSTSGKCDLIIDDDDTADAINK